MINIEYKSNWNENIKTVVDFQTQDNIKKCFIVFLAIVLMYNKKKKIESLKSIKQKWLSESLFLLLFGI